MSGLIPMSVVAEFLGKRPQQMKAVVEMDGLPVIHVPSQTKQVAKCSLLGLHGWLRKRSLNTALTVEELEHELERAASAIRRRRGNKAEGRRQEATGNRGAAA